MKVAIPIQDQVLAATFDFATQILVVTHMKAKIIDRSNQEINEILPSLRAARLKQWHINTLICGAISNALAVMIWHQDITIISGISGNVNTILEAYLNGSPNLVHHRLPGFTGQLWEGCCPRNQRRTQKI